MFTTPPITCDIELSHATRIFYSGDQICGTITLHAAKKTQLEGISINLAGLECVQWTEYSKSIAVSYDDSTAHEAEAANRVEYKGSQEHSLATLQLSEATILEPGKFVADFVLALPTQLLPTCKQANGCLDYQLRVVLQRKTKWQKLFQKRLILRNRLDLNHVARLNVPFALTCCALPDNQINFRIPHTGFVPGQLVPFSLQMSRLLYKAKVVINLCQKIAYSSQTPLPKLKEVTKVLDFRIATSDEVGQLQLPLSLDISTTAADGQSLICVSYSLEFLVLNENLEVAHRALVPLTVGSVALVGSENTQRFEKQSSLHYYDNLATSKYELQNQERALNKLINFDQVTCQAVKCEKYNQQRFSSDFKRLFAKTYNKIAV